jgi:hypothetical protein
LGLRLSVEEPSPVPTSSTHASRIRDVNFAITLEKAGAEWSSQAVISARQGPYDAALDLTGFSPRSASAGRGNATVTLINFWNQIRMTDSTFALDAGQS